MLCGQAGVTLKVPLCPQRFKDSVTNEETDPSKITKHINWKAVFLTVLKLFHKNMAITIT